MTVFRERNLGEIYTFSTAAAPVNACILGISVQCLFSNLIFNLYCPTDPGRLLQRDLDPSLSLLHGVGLHRHEGPDGPRNKRRHGCNHGTRNLQIVSSFVSYVFYFLFCSSLPASTPRVG